MPQLKSQQTAMTPPFALNTLVIAVKGAGEMASAVAWRLHRSGFRQVYMMETLTPLAVRRNVCFSEAIYDGTTVVEGVTAGRAASAADIPLYWEAGQIPVLADPGWQALGLQPAQVVVDAILAKKNLGTHTGEADLVIGLGPGFTAGADVHIVIETNRGHDLGRVINKGSAQPNTGVPGAIQGVTTARVLRAPCPGVVNGRLDIGTSVKQGETIGFVGQAPILAGIDGALRGLIRSGAHVPKGCKIGDIDPRNQPGYCTTISEKARAIAGSVLEAVLHRFNT